MVVIVGLISPTSAQGFLGSAFSAMPSPSRWLTGASGCSDTSHVRLRAPVFYVGWTGDRTGTTYEVSDNFGSLRHRFTLRGVWLGLAETVSLNDSLDTIFSGWTLVQAKNVPMYEGGGETPYQWEKTPTDWYFVDGLLAFKSCSGFAPLAGFRYEHFTSHFRQLRPAVAPDSGDVKINHYIPLVGAQWSYLGTDTNLMVRAVGFPIQFGHIDLSELFDVVPAKWNGTYKNGYFLEVFSEYALKLGNAHVGVFGRWNLSHATANVRLDEGGGISMDFAFQRTTWTVGGSLCLDFATPL
jgi:hypothetical protein